MYFPDGTIRILHRPQESIFKKTLDRTDPGECFEFSVVQFSDVRWIGGIEFGFHGHELRLLTRNTLFRLDSLTGFIYERRNVDRIFRVYGQKHQSYYEREPNVLCDPVQETCWELYRMGDRDYLAPPDYCSIHLNPPYVLYRCGTIPSEACSFRGVFQVQWKMPKEVFEDEYKRREYTPEEGAVWNDRFVVTWFHTRIAVWEKKKAVLKKKWERDVGVGLAGIPVFHAGVLMMPLRSNLLIGYDIRSGFRKWVRNFQGMPYAFATLVRGADKYLFLATDEGECEIVDPVSGTALWSCRGWRLQAFDFSSEKLYVLTTGGVLIAFDMNWMSGSLPKYKPVLFQGTAPRGGGERIGRRPRLIQR